jgi:hypothetical protein
MLGFSALPETVVACPTYSGGTAQPVHDCPRFARLLDLLIESVPPLTATGRGCSLKRRNAFLKSRSPWLACISSAPSDWRSAEASGARKATWPFLARVRSRTANSMPIGSLSWNVRSASRPYLFRSRSRALQPTSIHGNILVGAPALFFSIQCSWPLNRLSHFWGALQLTLPTAIPYTRPSTKHELTRVFTNLLHGLPPSGKPITRCYTPANEVQGPARQSPKNPLGSH